MSAPLNGTPVFLLHQDNGPGLSELLDIFESPQDAMIRVEFSMGTGPIVWHHDTLMQRWTAAGVLPRGLRVTAFVISQFCIQGRTGNTLEKRRSVEREKTAAAERGAAAWVAKLKEAQENL
jgi:hypothetical protein